MRRASTVLRSSNNWKISVMSNSVMRTNRSINPISHLRFLYTVSMTPHRHLRFLYTVSMPPHHHLRFLYTVSMPPHRHLRFLYTVSMTPHHHSLFATPSLFHHPLLQQFLRRQQVERSTRVPFHELSFLPLITPVKPCDMRKQSFYGIEIIHVYYVAWRGVSSSLAAFSWSSSSRTAEKVSARM